MNCSKKKCSLCKKKFTIFITCNYCNKNYCIKHNMPELHNCINITNIDKNNLKLEKITSIKVEKI